MATPDALLVIVRHAPHSSNWLRAFGQPVHLLFMGQGIMALLKEQGSGAPGQKATLPTIDMLEMYDIDKLWVTEGALQGMHLSADSLVGGVTMITEQEVPEILQQHSKILNF